MKNVKFLIKSSLILIMLLGFLRLQAHSVRAEETNPPPVPETTDGSSPSPDSNSGVNDSSGTTGALSASTDEDTSNQTGASNSLGDAASSAGASSTSTDEDTSNQAGTSNSSGDSSTGSTDPSTTAGDDASGAADSSTSPDEGVSDPADSSTSPNDAVSEPADSSISTDEAASDVADSTTSPDGSASDPATSSESTGIEESSSPDTEIADEAAEIIEEAAEKDITLADGDGQPITAADAQAQELLTSTASDPWFDAGNGVIRGYTSGGTCAAGVNDCHSGVSNSIQAALDDPDSAGKTIHIEAGDYSAETFTLNDDTRSFNLGSNISVNTINLNTTYDFVSKVVGGFFSALNVWLNFGGPQTATIQEGVDLTESGGTLNVASKTYNENVTVASTKSGITIKGHGNPTLNGSWIPYTGVPKEEINGFDVQANDVTISGFTIQNYWRGIRVNNSTDFYAHDNTFYHNSVGLSTNLSTAVLSNNTFGDATDPSKGNDTGISVGESTTLFSNGNQFFYNFHGADLASLGSKSKGFFSGDVFVNNHMGIHVVSNADVTGSTFIGNEYGVSVSPFGAVFTSHGNTYSENHIGVRTFGGANKTIIYDNFVSNDIGIYSDFALDMQVHFSRFYDNGYAIYDDGFGCGFVQADNNWWGDNQGSAGKITGNAVATNWLALDMTPSNDPINSGGEISQLTTQMVVTDGTTKTPLTDPELAAIQAAWFNYTSAPVLNTPILGTLNGDTFTSGEYGGDAQFSDTKFDDQTPTTKITIIGPPAPVDPIVPIVPENPNDPSVPANPGSPPMTANQGSPAAPAPIPQIVIPVTGDNLVDLVCGGPSQLVLENGSNVIIPSLTPCTMQASFKQEAIEGLPGPLPEGVEFVNALSVTVVSDGNGLDALPQEALLQVSFAGQQVNETGSLAIYWWDGNAWQEVPMNSIGSAVSNNTGLFVLVTK